MTLQPTGNQTKSDTFWYSYECKDDNDKQVVVRVYQDTLCIALIDKIINSAADKYARGEAKMNDDGVSVVTMLAEDVK